jgi:type VI secretion system Hcp family effector
MGIFLQLEGIDSDASDKNHKGWIACDSFTDGASRATYLEVGGGSQRETSSAELHEVGLRMKMHKGSPKVFLASLVGDARKGTIHITRSSDTTGTKNYLEVELSDVYVTRYSVDASTDGDSKVPWESISLNFSEIKKKYIPNGPDGKPASPVPVGFSGKTGKKL